MNQLKSIAVVLCTLAMCIITSCKEESKDNSIDGVYASIGYGTLVKIEDGNYIIADRTEISCTPIMDGSVDEFPGDILKNNDTLQIKMGINTYYFSQIEDAPEICKADSKAYKEAEAKANDPEYNFEVLWRNFLDHYAYFELRDVDPDVMYNKYRSMVTAETTDAELYLILEEMLDSFNDGHIGLSAPDEVEEAAEALYEETNNTDQSSEDAPKKNLRNYEVAKIIADKYIPEGTSEKNGNIRWGITNNNVGYFQLNQMFGVADYKLSDTLSYREYWMAYFEIGGNTVDEVDGINTSLDKIMAEFKDTDAIIIDLRFNGGGTDEVGMTVLQRFNDTEQVTFTKKGKHNNGFTPINNVVQPATDAPYTNPVYLLISAESASATEIMTLSSLSMPNIIRIGSRTEGVFSDVLDKTLPNGWEVGLSNEVYLDTKGNNYEGIGISPDIEITYPRERQGFLNMIIDDLSADGDQSINAVFEKLKTE